jgi:hypothetical protein
MAHSKVLKKKEEMISIGNRKETTVKTWHRFNIAIDCGIEQKVRRNEMKAISNSASHVIIWILQ